MTPSDFSSRRDKRRLVEIRCSTDAVLAGAATIAADNMVMGVPPDLREQRVAEGLSANPLRILLTNSGRIDPELKVFQKNISPIHIFSTTRMPLKVRAALAEHATLHLGEGASVNLAGMMAVLRKDLGVRRLVCEGGPQVFRALVAGELMDELHLTLCPRVFGGVKTPTLTGVPGNFLPKSIELVLRSMEVMDGECFLRYRIRHPLPRVSHNPPS